MWCIVHIGNTIWYLHTFVFGNIKEDQYSPFWNINFHVMVASHQFHTTQKTRSWILSQRSDTDIFGGSLSQRSGGEQGYLFLFVYLKFVWNSRPLYFGAKRAFSLNYALACMGYTLNHRKFNFKKFSTLTQIRDNDLSLIILSEWSH